MVHRHMYSTIDRTFRDIMRREYADNNDAFFGNKLMLFGGDFRQILPVASKGNRDAIVKVSLKTLDFGSLLDYIN